MNSDVCIAICDDEDFYTEQIHKCLERKMRGIPCRFICVKSGDELLRVCGSGKVDAVFLDIAMPGISGFETAKQLRQIREDIILIFVSSMENMVYSSYEYQPFWFVPKTQMWLLDKAADNMIKKIIQSRTKNGVAPLRIGTKVIEIDTVSTAYFCTYGHYIKFADINGSVSDSFRCKLDAVEEQLSEFGFIRAHRRFLVNLRCVRSVTKNMLELQGGAWVPVSRTNIAAVKQEFQKYLRSI